MRPLYLSDPVQSGLGRCLRPGGNELTGQMLRMAQVAAKTTILDAGCGPGASMDYLRAHGFCHVFGTDISRELLQTASVHHPVAQADLASLPFADHSFGLILCQCAWNLTRREATLAEYFRTLYPGGRLAISDIYLQSGGRNSYWPVHSCFNQAGSLDEVRRLVEKQGFAIERLVDISSFLKQTAAEFVFAHGSLHNFWHAVTGDASLARQACTAAKKGKPGLFLLIAQRE